ncbi:MAG TPA: ADP-ribosylglycohydrolase family protein, partial [bacterium]|nr:ADP-ribosylglycohydrolase family protein [bacterium]
LLDVEFDPSLIQHMLPNDDLDLQVLWLSVVEAKGVRFTSEDLAEAFLNRCPYAPGEYAYFKKNYARGIRPPLCGSFNNPYYIQGMGCPIRSEIWSCLAPANPQLAAECAAKDGILDHAGDSVYAEQFLAAMESVAFVGEDLDILIGIGLNLIPPESRISELIRDVRHWCTYHTDWKQIRGRILQKYGHPDCTNLYQNMGFLLMALILGEKDFAKTLLMAINCGFDTDCTASTAGALLGILSGAESLLKEYPIEDPRFVLGVQAERCSDRILDLAEDTARMGLHFAKYLNAHVEFENAPEAPMIELPAPTPISISVNYQGPPAIGLGGSRRLELVFGNSAQWPVEGTARLVLPEGWLADTRKRNLHLIPGSAVSWEVDVAAPGNLDSLNETNILRVEWQPLNEEPVSHQFGLVGAAVWEVFGPFWQNNVEIPSLKKGESYYAHISGTDNNDRADQVRTYHLNTTVDLDRDYMSLEDLLTHGIAGDPATEPRVYNAFEDKISVSNLVGFQGPCVVYLVRRMFSPHARSLGVQIGHTDAYRLWINERLVSKSDSVDWWTPENVHLLDFHIRKGLNTIVWKLIRRTGEAYFSLNFTKGGPCTDHYCDFASGNPGIH